MFNFKIKYKDNFANTRLTYTIYRILKSVKSIVSLIQRWKRKGKERYKMWPIECLPCSLQISYHVQYSKNKHEIKWRNCISSLVRNSSQKFQRNGTFQALGSHAPIVPTKILGDPDELDRHLVHSVPETYNIRHVQPDIAYDNGYIFSQESDVEMHVSRQNLMTFHRSYPFILSFRQHVLLPTVPFSAWKLSSWFINVLNALGRVFRRNEHPFAESGIEYPNALKIHL